DEGIPHAGVERRRRIDVVAVHHPRQPDDPAVPGQHRPLDLHPVRELPDNGRLGQRRAASGGRGHALNSKPLHSKRTGMGRTMRRMDESTATAGTRILVVDDEESITDLLATALRYERFEVDVA